MISNERPSPYGMRPSYNPGISKYGGYPPPFKPKVAENTLKSQIINVERKTFVFMLKENPVGRFLRITEDVHGRRNSIIVPLAGLDEFKKALLEVTKDLDTLPPTQMMPGQMPGQMPPAAPGEVPPPIPTP